MDWEMMLGAARGRRMRIRTSATATATNEMATASNARRSVGEGIATVAGTGGGIGGGATGGGISSFAKASEDGADCGFDGSEAGAATVLGV